MSFELIRTKQCAKCPWKVSTNPYDIPDGYCEVKHANLKNTIADSNNPVESFYKPTPAMACHHSDGNDEMYCIGYLNHQLGIGNNIGLRMKMMSCANIKDMKVYGEQYERFEDTLATTKQVTNE